MQLKKLDSCFYEENNHLVQALDNHSGNWEAGKTRGYGIVVIDFKGLKFAIPLRTNIKHDAAYITVRSSEPNIKGKGLDYSKAVETVKVFKTSGILEKKNTEKLEKC